MAQITAIAPSRRNPDRASIRVDGKAAASLSFKRVADLGLVVGQAWTDDLAARVAREAMYDKAMRRAMNRLGARAMSRSQLDRKLRDLEFDEVTRTRTLDRLEELGLLDDEAFARAAVRSELSRKPAGPRLLQQKLWQKGIDRKLADRVIEEELEPVDAVAEATDLARRRLRSMGRLDPVARKRRLYGLLARRGFGPDTIGRVMETLRHEIGDSI